MSEYLAVEGTIEVVSGLVDGSSLESGIVKPGGNEWIHGNSGFAASIGHRKRVLL